MRLSEFTGSACLFEAIMRARERGTITLAEEKEICRDMLESIKGNNHIVDNFISQNATSLPVANKEYFPMGIIFLIGHDEIELKYTDHPLSFVNETNGDFIYTDSNKKYSFPPITNAQYASSATFHCKTHNESEELRSMIHLTFGDCKIVEHKL
jgi:hypothetical protein